MRRTFLAQCGASPLPSRRAYLEEYTVSEGYMPSIAIASDDRQAALHAGQNFCRSVKVPKHKAATNDDAGRGPDGAAHRDQKLHEISFALRKTWLPRQ